MRILIFISHPAQFYFYREPVKLLTEAGDEVHILIKTKDILEDLIKASGLKYTNIQPVERKNNRLAMFAGFVKRGIKIYRYASKNKIQIIAGTDASVAHAAKLLQIPAITTTEDDYDVVPMLALLTYPFTSAIAAPAECNVGKWKYKKIDYEGYMKLSYLHPLVFKPAREKVEINSDTPFFIIRLSGLKAHHDKGESGISEELLDRIIGKLSLRGKILLSTERALPDKYAPFLSDIPYLDIHHYLFFAELLICDSQSMAVEAAILGTPGIRISSFSGRITVLEDLEHKYKLTFGIKPENETRAVEVLDQLISMQDRKAIFRERANTMISEKINVAPFIARLLHEFPENPASFLKEYKH